ncbi:MAG: hypothetical protein C5B51_08470 [Terriglobia bacterium]|nr:MAG: hypothetical protein C5B51_08470 [Terriglobia bacterium]
MSFSIQTNVSSMVAQENLRVNNLFQARTIQRLTSGYRINSAGDDAAGLAVANKFRSDVAELSQGVRNANDAVSQLQIMDGGLSNISQLLDRARTLATQSASDSFTGDRSALDGEFQNVLTEINRQAQSIGMTAGGDFAKSLGIFIGGGRTDSSSTTKNVNGTVTVNLSSSLADSTSLGLSSNGVQGVVVTAGSANLSSAITAAGTDAIFRFRGAGFNTTVNFATNFDATHIKNETDLVNAVNSAISTAAQSDANFAAANIRASVDSASGKLTFTSAGAFSVSDAGAGTGAAEVLLGDTAPHNAALASVALAAAAVTTNKDVLTISYRDSSGTLQQHSLDLTTVNAGSANAIRDAINGDTTFTGYGIFAVNNAGTITIMKKDGGAFEVATNLTGAGAAGGFTDGVYGSSSTPLGNSAAVDITTSAKALSTITALQTAVTNLSRIQATVGRAENQLSYATNLAQSQISNFSAAQSQIRDADVAAEAANLTKAQVLQQASMAAMAQANSAPQAVLALLRG